MKAKRKEKKRKRKTEENDEKHGKKVIDVSVFCLSAVTM